MTAVAHTALGDLAGRREDGVTVFRGVPYTLPPLGDRRFAPPAPHPPWTGVRDADAHGPIAPQAPSRLAAAMGAFERPQSEDCLTLTIWTPAADAVRRPVLVWLHGGAWISGAGSLDWYDGGRLAREADIVVVGVNYRLGALGYLHWPGQTPEAGDPGTLDQIAALAWVREHIGAFGGDAARVTLAGQSAGAASIGRLLLDPVARPLFARAILQSGSFGRAPLGRTAAAATGEAFIRLLGLDPDGADLTARLRAVPPAALVQAQGALARARARFGETDPPFMPTLPGSMEQPELITAIAAAAAGKALLIGATTDEVRAFFVPDPAMAVPDPGQIAARVAAMAGDADALARYRRRRPGASGAELLADAATDHVFLWPAIDLAEAAARSGATVFGYQFDWAPPGSRFGACHCIELPFVFGTLDAWPGAAMLAGGDPGVMRDLSALMRRCWTTFVRDGDPSLPGLPWPRYDAAARATMRLGALCEVAGDPAGLEWRRGPLPVRPGGGR